MRTKLSTTMLLLTSLTALPMLHACAGKEAASNKEAEASPTPSQINTPAPTHTPVAVASPSPTPLVVCSFIWETVTKATLDVYEVDLNASVLATSGAVAIDGVNVQTFYILGLDTAANTFTSAGVATSGSITVMVSGTAGGTAATISDTATLTYFAATADYFNGTSSTLGTDVATGGTGTFTGDLTSSSAATPVEGTGTMTVTVGKAKTTFGGKASKTTADFGSCAAVSTSGS